MQLYIEVNLQQIAIIEIQNQVKRVDLNLQFAISLLCDYCLYSIAIDEMVTIGVISSVLIINVVISLLPLY